MSSVTTGMRFCAALSPVRDELTGRPRQAVRVRSGVDDDQDAREGRVVRCVGVAGLPAQQLHHHNAENLGSQMETPESLSKADHL